MVTVTACRGGSVGRRFGRLVTVTAGDTRPPAVNAV